MKKEFKLPTYLHPEEKCVLYYGPTMMCDNAVVKKVSFTTGKTLYDLECILSNDEPPARVYNVVSKYVMTMQQWREFNAYLSSDERTELLKSHPSFPNEELLAERIKNVSHADIETFRNKMSKNAITPDGKLRIEDIRGLVIFAIKMHLPMPETGQSLSLESNLYDDLGFYLVQIHYLSLRLIEQFKSIGINIDLTDDTVKSWQTVNDVIESFS